MLEQTSFALTDLHTLVLEKTLILVGWAVEGGHWKHMNIQYFREFFANVVVPGRA